MCELKSLLRCLGGVLKASKPPKIDPDGAKNQSGRRPRRFLASYWNSCTNKHCFSVARGGGVPAWPGHGGELLYRPSRLDRITILLQSSTGCSNLLWGWQGSPIYSFQQGGRRLGGTLQHACHREGTVADLGLKLI